LFAVLIVLYVLYVLIQLHQNLQTFDSLFLTGSSKHSPELPPSESRCETNYGRVKRIGCGIAEQNRGSPQFHALCLWS